MTKQYKLPAGRALVLRSCSADMTSTNDFQWPEVGGLAEAPDWKPTKECGYGLHGWLYGQGEARVSDWLGSDSKWLVVEVDESTIVMLGGKCKFPRGYVRFVGTRSEAADFIRSHEPRAKTVAVIGAVLQVGDGESVMVGALGTATAGDGGTATAGDGGTATAGYRGTATAGNDGTATAGNDGTATAGYRGTATAGYRGTATAGNGGTATAGNGGEIRLRYYDHESERYRTMIGYIGEDGLEPYVAYRLDDSQQFVKAS